jgi:hypothetical protein
VHKKANPSGEAMGLSSDYITAVADMAHNMANKTTKTPSFPMADHIVVDNVSD